MRKREGGRNQENKIKGGKREGKGAERGKQEVNKTLGRALDPRANGTWLSKLK